MFSLLIPCAGLEKVAVGFRKCAVVLKREHFYCVSFVLIEAIKKVMQKEATLRKLQEYERKSKDTQPRSAESVIVNKWAADQAHMGGRRRW